MNEDAPDPLDAISVLGERKRRAVYEHVAADGGWVSRDAVAVGVGIERATAIHHLDRLAAEGLVEVDYRRLGGRSGPGAGRPAKLYRRAEREFAVSLPQRNYELAGHLLAEAAERSRNDGIAFDDALRAVTSDHGRRLAEEITPRGVASSRAAITRRRRAVIEVLRREGFEPTVAEDGIVRLRNCPFHRLAQQHTELVCGMNHCLLSATMGAVGDAGLEARLEPVPGECCVRLHPTT